MSLLLVYVGLTIGVSFLCSIAEAVILSLNMSHIKVIKKKGKIKELKNIISQLKINSKKLIYEATFNPYFTNYSLF